MIKEETIERIRQFTIDRNWQQYHTPVNLAKSISIEASELLECFQWSDTDYDLNHVCEELADVMNYCIQMADVLGVDLDEIINAKCTQNEKKYPVEKAKGKYTKQAIIDEEQMNYDRRKNEKYQSTLLPLISSCLNHPGFKYTKKELPDVGIVEFMDSVQRLQIYESSRALLAGSYSGFVDTSKIDKSQFDFMRDISK